MARPKNTKTTKWVIRHESWHMTRKEALQAARFSKLPYEVKNVGDSKTFYGSYRRATWRERTFWPSLYRGQKIRAGPWNKKPTKDYKRYHRGYPLVKIRGGAWVVLEGPKAASMRRAESALKDIELKQAMRRAGKKALKKLSG